jgi:hypothetical protein
MRRFVAFDNSKKYTYATQAAVGMPALFRLFVDLKDENQNTRNQEPLLDLSIHQRARVRLATLRLPAPHAAATSCGFCKDAGREHPPALPALMLEMRES